MRFKFAFSPRDCWRRGSDTSKYRRPSGRASVGTSRLLRRTTLILNVNFTLHKISRLHKISHKNVLRIAGGRGRLESESCQWAGGRGASLRPSELPRQSGGRPDGGSPRRGARRETPASDLGLASSDPSFCDAISIVDFSELCPAKKYSNRGLN